MAKLPGAPEISSIKTSGLICRSCIGVDPIDQPSYIFGGMEYGGETKLLATVEINWVSTYVVPWALSNLERTMVLASSPVQLR